MEPETILKEVQNVDKITTIDLAAKLGVTHQAVVGAMKSLEGDGYIVATMQSVQQWKLNEEALSIIEAGSPEFRLFTALASGPQEQSELAASLGADVVANGMKNGMKDKLVKVSKDGGKVIISRNEAAPAEVKDSAREALQALKDGKALPAAEVDALKKRKLAAQETIKSFEIVKGPNFALERKKLATDITRQMLADGSWATATFKKLNFNAQGREPLGGNLHPLLKVRQEFREIFLELGFSEMDTQQWVESCFWNFDSLFVPQKHPARDAQDTFFVSKPAAAANPAQEYLDRVKANHEAGYHCDFSVEETQKNVLRTHTTSVSSWVLNKLAQSSPIDPETGKRNFKPGRYFSIDRVFRNEEMDKTHLCEFHQVEGFVVDRNLSLANMMHMLEQFFRRIGVEQLRFKPAYNPYTEPSMEIFGYHTGLKKWIEVGNSGMFRPEMLKPMGFDDDVSCIAWGLSLERPTMIKYGINNIHELFGNKVDLRFIRKARIARF